MKKIKEFFGTVKVWIKTVHELNKAPNFKLEQVFSSKWVWYVTTEEYQGYLGFWDYCKYLYKNGHHWTYKR